MQVKIVEGDLLDQTTEAIINPCNHNLFPWWLLWPKGVSGAIKRRAGTQPFKELGKKGIIPLGKAVSTSAGRMPQTYIIHTATITPKTHSSITIVQEAVYNVMELAGTLGVRSVAFPVLGSGSGKLAEETALNAMLTAFERLDSKLEVFVVRYIRAV